MLPACTPDRLRDKSDVVPLVDQSDLALLSEDAFRALQLQIQSELSADFHDWATAHKAGPVDRRFV